eukprot:Platyproteum_vivax@DN719_c0_g1_i1.p1
MGSRIKILFFHGLESEPGGQKELLLKSLYASHKVPPEVRGPDLLTKWRLRSGQIFFAMVVLCFLACSIICMIQLPIQHSPIVLAIFLVSDLAMFYTCKKWLLGVMLHTAIAVAHKHMVEFQPDIIAASSFGAVVALNLPRKDIPLLLFAPAQYALNRHLGLDSLYLSLKDYPFVYIVHGTKDKLIPIQDSYNLIQTAQDKHHYKIVEVDDNHLLLSLTQQKVQECIDELVSLSKLPTIV